MQRLRQAIQTPQCRAEQSVVALEERDVDMFTAGGHP